jgi:hypothetical protein
MSNDNNRRHPSREPHSAAGQPLSRGRQPRHPDGSQPDGPPSGHQQPGSPPWNGPQSDGPQWGGQQSGGPQWGGQQSGGPQWGGQQSGGPQWGGQQSGGPQRGDEQSGDPQRGDEQSGGPRPGGPPPGRMRPEDLQPGGERPQGAQPNGKTPGQPAEPAPRRKRSRSPWVFGLLLLAVVLGLAGVLVAALGWAGPVMSALGVDHNAKKAVDGRMNTPIADGTFEFTVTAARCGLDKVGDGKSAQPAQGQFCLIDVTVRNVGSSPVIFDDISQTAYDPTGNQYSADSTADVAANKGQPAFLQQIAPGATVRGRLAFDISTRETLTSVVLHESIFSAGVRIPLT